VSVALQIVHQWLCKLCNTHTHTTTVLALRGSYLSCRVILLEIAKAGRQVPMPRCLSLEIRIAGQDHLLQQVVLLHCLDFAQGLRNVIETNTILERFHCQVDRDSVIISWETMTC
jgi:hypothetical protein